MKFPERKIGHYMHLLFAHIRDYVLLCKKLSQSCGFPVNLKMMLLKPTISKNLLP